MGCLKTAPVHSLDLHYFQFRSFYSVIKYAKLHFLFNPVNQKLFSFLYNPLASLPQHHTSITAKGTFVMQKQANLIRIKRKTIFCFAVILLPLLVVTPALADYLGPDRTKTETGSVCKVILYECQYVASKDIWKYKSENSWPCSSESKPWQAYPSNSHTCTDNVHDAGYQYWEREDITQTVTNTYPPATIDSALQNCTSQNGWCITPPQLFLNGIEPVAGYEIIAIEGSLNGQNFACMSPSCSVPLNQGSNDFTYWALSSFGDSSTMGTLTASVEFTASQYFWHSHRSTGFKWLVS